MPEVEQMHEMSLEPVNWIPLERRIGRQCAEFMWMYRKDGVEFYKHVETRRYLLSTQNRDVTGKLVREGLWRLIFNRNFV